MELLVLLRFGTLLFEEEAISRLWSDVWPAMDGVVSLLTEVSHDVVRNNNNKKKINAYIHDQLVTNNLTISINKQS